MEEEKEEAVACGSQLQNEIAPCAKVARVEKEFS
jgi:hypothetical protein